MNQSTDIMLSLVKDIVRSELDKRDQVVICKVVETYKDGYYDLIVVPDESNKIKRMYTIANYALNTGDYVYLYKVKNSFQNAFIIGRVGGYHGTK